MRDTTVNNGPLTLRLPAGNEPAPTVHRARALASGDRLGEV